MTGAALETVTIVTRSPEETEALGKRLAALLAAGSVVALRGELASGKTCLVRGMASHFVKGDEVHSPTFTLVNEYGDDGTKLYHVDLYRMESVEEISTLGLEEILGAGGVTLVEWGDRLPTYHRAEAITIRLHDVGEGCRRIELDDPAPARGRSRRGDA